MLPLLSPYPWRQACLVSKAGSGWGWHVCELTPPLSTCLLFALKFRQLQTLEGGWEGRQVGAALKPRFPLRDGEMDPQKNKVFTVWGPLSFSLQLQGEGKTAGFGFSHPALTSIGRVLTWLLLNCSLC